ncbi:hypothetical protein N8455_00650, partial [Candidatus Gracilibacteria bacterium]|nr:hypothetical protein [Candidatus Gracilibacteria bacterium]
NPNYIQKVDMLLDNDVELYNSQLAKYNQGFYDSLDSLISGENQMRGDISSSGESLQNRINGGLTVYADGQSLLASSNGVANNATQNACQEQAVSDYRYDYKGLYTVERINGQDYSYRLFDYMDELTGKEIVKDIDFDNDGDSDLIYMMNDQLFLKENLEIKNNIFGTDVITIDSDDNSFFNDDVYYNSVDNFKEGLVGSNVINANFTSSSHPDISNYRMTFSRLVDQSTERKSIVDGFVDSVENTIDRENENFIFGNSLTYIDNVGNLKDIVLTTKEIFNIKDDLQNDSVVDLSAGTKLYAGNNPFRITYLFEGDEEEQIIVVAAHSYIEVKSSIEVIGISGNAYISGNYDKIVKGEDIRGYVGLPLSIGSHLTYKGNISSIEEMSYVELTHYEGTQTSINFNDVDEYWMYDLGLQQDNLSISMSMDNDYLYAYMQSFNKDVFSTYSEKILLSPQIVADGIPPKLYLNELRIPVYQEKIVNLEDFIFEAGGLNEIKAIEIDLDITIDSDGDGDTKNDIDISSDNIYKTSQILQVTFGPFNYLYKNKIGITLVDINNNASYDEVLFEIYAPTPEIITMNELGIIGKIDEELTQEPVSLYRYRGGIVTKLVNEEGTNIVLTDTGDYRFVVDDDQGGLTLEYGDTVVANISESTGKIDITDVSSFIRVLESNHVDNDSYYPEIQVMKNNLSIYEQHLQVSDISSIDVVDTFTGIEESGIYLDFTNTQYFGYYTIPETVSYNPGAFVIYRNDDPSKEALFIILPDGKIETLNEYYKLEYSDRNKYITLSLIDKYNDTQIAELLFKIDGGYIMK